MNQKSLKDNIFVVAISVVASLIAIFSFVTGYDHIPEFLCKVLPVFCPMEILIETKGSVWDVSITNPNSYQTHSIYSKEITNFLLEVDVTISDPAPEYHGVVFRKQDDEQFYSFRITQDGSFALDVWNGGGGHRRLVGPTASKQIKKGVGQTNRLKVVGTNSRFEMFINGEQVGVFTDDTYRSGTTGVISCTCDGSKQTSATFLNAVLIKNP